MKMRALSLILFTFISRMAMCDIEDGLEQMFQMSSAQLNGYYDSARRNGVVLPDVRIRTPMNSVNLINLQAPRVRGGCGGIDLYGGSFSFVNQEQFRQLLRQIGANALGYAFQLALSSMCDSCMTNLESLQKKINDLNKMNVDSCRWAQGITNSVMSASSESVRNYLNEKEMQDGGVDSFESIWSDFTGGWADAFNADATGVDSVALAAGTEVDTGNLVWNALRQGQALTAILGFTPQDVSVEEFLFNLSGTYILRAPNAAELAAGNSGAPMSHVDPTISFQELRKGKALAANGTSPVFSLNSCANTPCTTFSDTNWTFAGIDSWVLATFRSAIDHMKSPTTAGTDHADAEKMLIVISKLPVYQHLLRLQGDPAKLDTYAAMVAPYIADAYAAEFGQVLVDLVRSKLKLPGLPQEYLTTVYRNLDKMEVEIRFLRTEQAQNFAETFKIVDDWVKSVDAPKKALKTASKTN